MIQGRYSTSLTLEPFNGRAILRQLVGEKLQGDRPAESDVFCLVDHAHAAGTELLPDGVVGEGGADHVVGVSGAHLFKPQRELPAPLSRWA
jgi:hypothetical protein